MSENKTGMITECLTPLYGVSGSLSGGQSGSGGGRETKDQGELSFSGQLLQ